MNTAFLTRQRGFTFIELLLTVAIMITVLGGGLVGYINFNDKQTVLETAKKVQSMLKAARTKAQVRDTPSGCATTGPPATALYGFHVAVDSTAPGATVSLSAWCGESLATSAAHQPATDSFVLPSSVRASQNFSIIFNTLHGGTNLGSDQEIVITNDSQTYRFSVTPGGEITEGCWGDVACQ